MTQLICYVEHKFRESQLDRIKQANRIIQEYERAGFVLTLRQLYYQFVARALIPNTERSYKNLGALLNRARLAGLVPWDALEDRTRFLRSRPHWDSPAGIVSSAASQFAVDKWKDQDCYVEVWVEKDALVGVIEDACTKYDVPFFSCRGYVSVSELWNAAQRMDSKTEDGKRCVLIHLGDHDPSGLDMTRDIADRLETFGTQVEVLRVALTMDQINELSPPPNPAKVTDVRFEKYREEFGDESWELDALDPKYLDQLVRDSITNFLDPVEFDKAERRESAGRIELREVAHRWSDVRNLIRKGRTKK